MNKKVVCESNPTFAVICRGYVGLELRYIDYTADGDFIYYVEQHGSAQPSFHCAKIHYYNGDPYINIPSRCYLKNALRI